MRPFAINSSWKSRSTKCVAQGDERILDIMLEFRLRLRPLQQIFIPADDAVRRLGKRHGQQSGDIENRVALPAPVPVRFR